VNDRLETATDRSQRESEAGVALVVVALSMVILMGFLGLGIDLSYLRQTKLRMQTAADAAALAGASELNYGDVTSAAQSDAATNGFTNGANGVTVTVNNPPQTATDPHYNDSNYVEAIISQSVPTMFAKIFGTKTVTVEARSEAHLGSAPNCMYALNPTAQDAVTINGTSISSECGMIDDSSASQALLINGSTYSGTTVSVTGGDLINGSTVTPTPQTSVAATPNPLAYLSAPTVGSCQYNNTLVNGTSATLYPGVYCGGLSVNGSTLTTFSAGTYIIASGGMTINGSSVSGNGVTFYVASGSVIFNGTNHVNLVAPTTGTYAGILFFQSSSDTQAAILNGDSTSVFQGALYFPGANLTLNGDGSGTAYTIVVASTMVLNGDNINNDYSSLPGGSPVRSNTAVLDE
jgi:Flp pilus assembly protein TadG